MVPKMLITEILEQFQNQVNNTWGWHFVTEVFNETACVIVTVVYRVLCKAILEFLE